MAKDKTMETQNEPTTNDADKDRARLPSVVYLALDVADRGQSTALSVLNDARVELRTATDHVIELAEKLATSGFRFARKLTQRLDEASASALTGAERALANTIKTARETTKTAQDLATQAKRTVTGKQTAQA
ncbi:MAG TPA: hypothetical protein VFQ53_25670 [Kofleriaceae bacterium]|nr:hypothetical protein [Kofleriaceae bacterium]